MRSYYNSKMKPTEFVGKAVNCQSIQSHRILRFSGKKWWKHPINKVI